MNRGPNDVDHYDGNGDWLFFSDSSDVSVPRIDLVAHNTENEFSANVTKPSLRADQVAWIEGTTLVIYRQACSSSGRRRPSSSSSSSFRSQYLMNYYHVVMDDMIGIWWTIQHHLPHTPRDVQFLFVDDHEDTAIETETMMTSASLALLLSLSHTSPLLRSQSADDKAVDVSQGVARARRARLLSSTARGPGRALVGRTGSTLHQRSGRENTLFCE